MLFQLSEKLDTFEANIDKRFAEWELKLSRARFMQK